jgi:hypothetical protein
MVIQLMSRQHSILCAHKSKMEGNSAIQALPHTCERYGDLYGRSSATRRAASASPYLWHILPLLTHELIRSVHRPQ